MLQIFEKKEIWKIATITSVMIVLTAVIVNAGDAPKILPIKPVPNITSGEVSSSEQAKSLYHGGGFINIIGKDDQGRNMMVINDRIKYFAPNVHYYSSKGGRLSSSQFKIGNEVGYIVNQKKEITDLYLFIK